MADGKLEGHVAFVTGAGSGIGQATTRRMAQEGAMVAAVGIPPDGVEATAQQVGDTGGDALALPTDVSDPAQIERAVASTVARFGHIDIVVASAAVQMHTEDRDLHVMGRCRLGSNPRHQLPWRLSHVQAHAQPDGISGPRWRHHHRFIRHRPRRRFGQRQLHERKAQSDRPRASHRRPLRGARHPM